MTSCEPGMSAEWIAGMLDATLVSVRQLEGSCMRAFGIWAGKQLARRPLGARASPPRCTHIVINDQCCMMSAAINELAARGGVSTLARTSVGCCGPS